MTLQAQTGKSELAADYFLEQEQEVLFSAAHVLGQACGQLSAASPEKPDGPSGPQTFWDLVVL